MLKVKNDVLRTRVTLSKRAIANEEMAQQESTRMHAPMSKCFQGARDAKKMENHLWEIKNYF